MPKKTARIDYFVIEKWNYRKPSEDSPVIDTMFPIYEILKHAFNRRPKTERFFDLKNDRFCFVDSLSADGELTYGYLKSARNKFRPNLIHKITGNERLNPKNRNEGDIEKTHFAIRIHKNDNRLYLLYESNYTGVSIKSFAGYLTKCAKDYCSSKNISKQFTIKYASIIKDNFEEELNKLSRVKVAQIYVDKKILGSKFLDFSNRTQEIQEEVFIEVRSTLKESIKGFALDALNKFKKGSVRSIKIYGLDEDENETRFDTTFIPQNELVLTEVDSDTGELKTIDLLDNLKNFARNI